MPEAIIPLAGIVFGCSVAIVSIIFKFTKWKTMHNTERMKLKQGLDNSISSGELQDLISEAVANATADLQAEIAELKAEKQGRISLDDLDENDYEMSQINAPQRLKH